MKTSALANIRMQNLRCMLDLLTHSPAMTRQALSEASGLSLMTVTNLVELLKKQGVLQLTPIDRGNSARPVHGRKAEAITLSGTKKAWLITDISGIQFRMTLMGFDARILLEIHDDQPGEYIPRLESFLRNAREKVLSALEGRELLGVAIVAPGPYEIESDTVFNQRLPQLNGVKIKDLFQRCFGVHEYYVDEDVKFAVRAFPALIDQSELLYYLYIGEGVGGAAVHSGNMLRGRNATAGDAGHLLDGQGRTYESRLNTAAFMQQLGLADTALPEAMQQTIQEHPEHCRAVLQGMSAITAEMLHGVMWLLDPTHLIIDCPYAEPFMTDFTAWVGAALAARFEGENRQLPEIAAPAPGLGSVLRGAIRVLQKAWLERILS